MPRGLPRGMSNQGRSAWGGGVCQTDRMTDRCKNITLRAVTNLMCE